MAKETCPVQEGIGIIIAVVRVVAPICILMMPTTALAALVPNNTSHNEATQAQSTDSPWSIAGALATILTTVGGIALFMYDRRTKIVRTLVVKGWLAVRKRCTKETIEHDELERQGREDEVADEPDVVGDRLGLDTLSISTNLIKKSWGNGVGKGSKIGTEGKAIDTKRLSDEEKMAFAHALRRADSTENEMLAEQQNWRELQLFHLVVEENSNGEGPSSSQFPRY